MEAYRAAWISNVPNEVAALFTEDAVYSVSPFTEPWIGRDEIVRRWVAGIQQDVEMTYDVLAADGDQAIIHWHVSTRNVGDPVRVEYDGVLVVRFAPDALCGASRVLPTRAPGVNLRPCPSATSSTARTCGRGRSTRFGERRTTPMTRSSRSKSTASMENRIPNV
jgi:hypothetical protein